jgi:hypothetical protein
VIMLFRLSAIVRDTVTSFVFEGWVPRILASSTLLHCLAGPAFVYYIWFSTYTAESKLTGKHSGSSFSLWLFVLKYVRVCS